ncbi:MAG: winged helix-turn-helix domain-containing protein [Candidatus Hodarchaeales archaeon]
MEKNNKQAGDLLQGKTLKIYWYILTRGESGIREIQRNLHISSPSTVSHHVNKLIEAGYVIKQNDKYIVCETAKTGILKLYFKIGRYMIPRMLFYFSFFLISLILYLFLMLLRGVFIVFAEDVLFLLLAACGMLFFIIEAYRIQTMKPG